MKRFRKDTRIQLNNCTVFLPKQKLIDLMLEGNEELRKDVERIQKENEHLRKRLKQNGIVY